MRHFLLLCFFALSHFALAQESLTSKAAATAMDKKEFIFIEPKQRSEDFLQAYEMMKKGKSPEKIAFLLMDGSQISNILEVTLMGNGTLLLLKIGTTLGHQLELVRVENLSTITQL